MMDVLCVYLDSLLPQMEVTSRASSSESNIGKRKARKDGGSGGGKKAKQGGRSILKDEGVPTYKTIKFMIKKLFSKEQVVKIEQAVQVAHRVATLTLDLCKLYYLDKYHSNQPLPQLDKTFYQALIGVVTRPPDTRNNQPRGRPRTTNAGLHDELLDFHTNTFLPISAENARITVTNMSKIFPYMAETFATVQTTNVTTNFPKYVRRYINKFFRQQLYVNNNWPDDYRMSAAENQDFRTTCRHLKEDVLFYRKWRGGYQSDQQYHDILDSFVNVIYPAPEDEQVREGGVHYDVFRRPHVYLRYMVGINLMLEEMGARMYSPLCVRSSLGAKYIKIDTHALIDLLVGDQDIEVLRLELNLPNLIAKGQLYDSPSKLLGRAVSKQEAFYFKTRIWKCMVRFNHNKHTRHLLERGNFVFDNSILTDGVGVSVLQVHRDRVGESARANRSVQFVPEDVPYLSELSQEERSFLVNKTNIVACDPGNKNVLFLNDGVKTLRYSAQQRAVEGRFKKNKRAMVSMKRTLVCPNGDSVEENERVTTYVSKTCAYANFVAYIRSRRELEKQVVPTMYSRPTVRKLRFSAMSHTKSSEDRLLQQVVKTFGSQEQAGITVAWGNWSLRENMRHFIPTPGVGLRQRLRRKGKVLGIRIGLVHEAFTSSVCSDCHARTEYWKQRTFKRGSRRCTMTVHGLLRCQNERCSKLWNRDVLGSRNIREVAMAVLEDRVRPAHFTIAHAHHAANG